MSYVDGGHNTRGWAFRATYGPDPVNGLALLAEMRTRRNQNPDSTGTCRYRRCGTASPGGSSATGCRTIGISGRRFGALATAVIDTYRPTSPRRSEQLDKKWIRPNVNRGVNAVGGEGAAAANAHAVLLDTFRSSGDGGHRRFLLSGGKTEADIRLFRHARALRPDRQRGSHHRPRPCRSTRSCGPLRPRHYSIPTTFVTRPTSRRFQRARFVESGRSSGRPADGGRLMAEPRPLHLAHGLTGPDSTLQLARPLGAPHRDLHREVLDVAGAHRRAAASSTSAAARLLSCSRRSSACRTGATTRSAGASTRC